MADPKKPKIEDDGGIDDWEKAIDEWDHNLDKLTTDGKPEVKAAPKPVPKPAPKPTPSEDEPPALEAPPLAAAPEEDPLMHLFDGDMELPEEAGEALGSLLGAEDQVAVPPAAMDDREVEIEIG